MAPTESFHFLKIQIPMAAATTTAPTTIAAVTRPPLPFGGSGGGVAEGVPVAPDTVACDGMFPPVVSLLLEGADV